MDATEVSVIPTSGVNSMICASRDGQPVLLIGLKEAYQEKTQYQKALKREYDRCKDLDHPHLMKMIAFEEVKPYGNCIVMDFEPARPLADYYKENHSEDENREIILQIADALDYLHKNNIVHGALNPYTIYVTTQGDQVCIINFRQQFADDLLESTRTARYVAPEAEDGTVALDGRADIYALGMIMRDMHFGSDYYNIIQRCTGFGRSERYFDIDAFLGDFDHRHTSSSSSHTGLYALVGALVVVLAGILIWVFAHGSGDNQSQQPAQDGTEQAATDMSDTTNNDTQAVPSTAAVDQADAAKTDATQPDGPQSGQPEASGEQQTYSGDNAFLNDLLPQMRIDIDKIYTKYLASATTPQAKAAAMKAVRAKVKVYYRGLRGTLKDKNQSQLAAFDQAFADYINQKNAH